MCLPYAYGPNHTCFTQMDQFLLDQQPWGVLNTSTPVDYCLSSGVQQLDNKCGVHFSIGIMVAVCVMNYIKCLCVCYTFLLFFDKKPSLQPLATIGDLIQSALTTTTNDPEDDDPTHRMCLASEKDFKKGIIWRSIRRHWKGPQTYRMLSLASKKRWFTTLGL